MTGFWFRSGQESGRGVWPTPEEGLRVFRVSPFRKRVGDLLAHFGE